MIQTADEAIEYIHSLSRFGKKSGLDNIRLIMNRLGNPQDKLKYVHIAGTNGKGSVSSMIKNILISHSYKVGHYASPYIEFFGERICIDNDMISDEDLVCYANRVKRVCEDIHPIEFEFITAMAFLYFYEKNCDVVVLEVGLGGRFDSTNIIRSPLVSVITSIGLDHTAILGDSIEKIAFEKSGIIKRNSIVIAGDKIDKSCIDVIQKKCNEECSKLIIPKKHMSDIRYEKDYTRFEYNGLNIKLPLKGTYQADNAKVAIESAYALKEQLGITDDDIERGLAMTSWKCRFEIIGSAPEIVLDGAHNSHAVRALMDGADVYYKNEKRVFVFSMLNEKDYKESIDLIADKCDYMIVTTVPSYRQTSANDIYEYVKEKKVNSVYLSDPLSALREAIRTAGDDGVVFVFGSLYLAGYLRKYAMKVK